MLNAANLVQPINLIHMGIYLKWLECLPRGGFGVRDGLHFTVDLNRIELCSLGEFKYSLMASLHNCKATSLRSIFLS